VSDRGVGPARQRLARWSRLWRRRRREEAAETAARAKPPHQASELQAAKLRDPAVPLSLCLDLERKHMGRDPALREGPHRKNQS
jgi:hypothetical protein